MPARFFVDENDLALGKRLAERRDGVVYPGHSDLPEVPRGSNDDEWLPIVGQRHLVVITRDKRIRYRPAEKRLWVIHGVRGFVLTGQQSQSTADTLSILDEHWPAIEDAVETGTDGPWMTAITRSRLREIDLG